MLSGITETGHLAVKDLSNDDADTELGLANVVLSRQEQ